MCKYRRLMIPKLTVLLNVLQELDIVHIMKICVDNCNKKGWIIWKKLLF